VARSVPKISLGLTNARHVDCGSGDDQEVDSDRESQNIGLESGGREGSGGEKRGKRRKSVREGTMAKVILARAGL